MGVLCGVNLLVVDVVGHSAYELSHRHRFIGVGVGVGLPVFIKACLASPLDWLWIYHQ